MDDGVHETEEWDYTLEEERERAEEEGYFDKDFQGQLESDVMERD